MCGIYLYIYIYIYIGRARVGAPAACGRNPSLGNGDAVTQIYAMLIEYS